MSANPLKIALLAALALLLLPAAAASASSTYDLTGTWELHNTSGPGADGAESLSMPDPAGGAFTGEFAGFPIHGTANGATVQFEIGEAPGYVSYNEATVEYNGTTLVMNGHWHDTFGQSGEYVSTLQGGYTPGEGAPGESTPSEGGSGPAVTGVALSCDAYSPGTPIEYFKCTGQVHGDGGPTPPTGTLAFSANEGGFPLGSTCNLQPGSGASSCTVAFYPGYGAAVTIKAAYSGDADYKAASGELGLQPDLGQDPSRALEVQACALFYSLSCRGLLPKPDPVQTCISSVESCNGFGGAKNAEPGTIDISSFPSSLIAKVGCQQSAKNPFGRVAASASADETAVAEGSACKIGGFLDGSPPRGTRLTKEEGAYLFNLAMFRSYAESLRSALVNTIGRMPTQFKFEPDAANLFEADLVAWIREVNEILNKAEEEGKPVDPRWALTDNCAEIFVASDLAAVCSAGLAKFNAAMLTGLKELKSRKHELGVDVPYKGSKAWLRAEAARPGRRHERGGAPHHAIAFAFGQVRLKPGKRGTLRMKVGRVARKALRHAAHRGQGRLKATLTVTATQGTVTTTRRVHVELLLRSSRKHRGRHAGSRGRPPSHG